MARHKKFSRAGSKLERNTVDSIGAVSIQMTLMNGGKHVKGNITKRFTVDKARVSEVAKAIEVALF